MKFQPPTDDRENRVPLNTEVFVKEFGLGGYHWDDIRGTLEQVWNDWAHDPVVATAFGEWSRYQSHFNGSVGVQRDLFLRHTYLTVLARLLVAVSVWPQEVAMMDPGGLESLIKGDFFRERGLLNVVEVDDPFIWVGKPEILNAMKRPVLELLGQLIAYDYDQLNEDILRGLYHELVDPETRHDQGEYQTPDLVCERIVEKILEDWTPLEKGVPTIISDPRASTSNFLRAGLRQLTTRLRAVGIPLADQPEILTTLVVGTDQHPLGVALAKANYVLAIKEVLAVKQQAVVVPIFLVDTTISPKSGRPIAS